jgi:hydroxymethylglutaryl-CoA reductase (NADPH)
MADKGLEKRRKSANICNELPSNFPYDLDTIHGCCESVIGYVPIPVGVAGPLPVDTMSTYIPLATTEGALVASVNRGCKLLRESGGVKTVCREEGMTRGPVITFPNITDAYRCADFVSSEAGFAFLKREFDATSRYARLTSVDTRQAGRSLFLRFQASTGEAMGMNMVGKGCEKALEALSNEFPSADIVSLSGNYCTDKRASALNWIEGRGRAVIAEATIDPSLIEKILHTTVDRLLQVHQQKCLVGSTLSGSIGGCNAHAANMVTAIFIATGQDVAQTVDSSYCLTQLERLADGRVHVSVTLPCLQVGTVGGGTRLPPQKACISLLTNGDASVDRVARNVAAAVLAGELSLLGSLAEGSLMKAHLSLNRLNSTL